MLCAPVKFEDIKMLRQANKQADLLEIRLDQFKPNDIKKLRRLCEKPVIFKMDRLDFEILECLPDYVDLPSKLSPRVFDDVKKKFPQIKRICSFHDVEKTGDLSAIYSQVSAVPAEIYKIATYATSTCDALRMLDLVKKKGCLGLCMGDYGAVTRILAPVFGAPWSYAPLSAAHQTATDT
jgi:3-dehydroquinate dehydratase type I